jgi:hypothetical protein
MCLIYSKEFQCDLRPVLLSQSNSSYHPECHPLEHRRLHSFDTIRYQQVPPSWHSCLQANWGSKRERWGLTLAEAHRQKKGRRKLRIGSFQGNYKANEICEWRRDGVGDSYEDELCTHVPPNRSRVPAAGLLAEGDEVSWFNKVIVRASPYVVPPMINIITSCGLTCTSSRQRVYWRIRLAMSDALLHASIWARTF